MPYAELNEVTLYYEEHGQGMPLLLLHAGWGLAVNDFAHQQNALAGEFRMIVPGRRGYGRSTRVQTLGANFHWQAADDMWALLGLLQVNQTCVWGHSDGAVIGAIRAITQPARVRGLVLGQPSLHSQATYAVSLRAGLSRSDLVA
jgi:pimeloyl-ACP methyl ester carboxylesterase